MSVKELRTIVGWVFFWGITLMIATGGASIIHPDIIENLLFQIIVLVMVCLLFFGAAILARKSEKTAERMTLYLMLVLGAAVPFGSLYPFLPLWAIGLVSVVLVAIAWVLPYFLVRWNLERTEPLFPGWQ